MFTPVIPCGILQRRPPMLASPTIMKRFFTSNLGSLGLLGWSVWASLGCGAVYPEVATPTRAVAPGREVAPSPPPDLLYIVFDKAIIPRQTRDGRKWDSVGGDAPDPFAKVLVNGEEIIKTPIESNTLHPKWPNQVRANYQVDRGAKVVVELWDSNPINNDPICRTSVEFIHDKVGGGTSELLCNSGARILLRVESAHAMVGLGMYYELQSQKVKVTRVIQHSPASRAGLVPNTELIAIQGELVGQLDADQVRSMINANAPTGLKLDAKLPDGTNKQVELKEAAMYPLVSEKIELR
jgi:hypothetical protein